MSPARKEPTIRAHSVGTDDGYVVLWVVVGKYDNLRPVRMAKSKAIAIMSELAAAISRVEKS